MNKEVDCVLHPAGRCPDFMGCQGCEHLLPASAQDLIASECQKGPIQISNSKLVDFMLIQKEMRI